MWQKLKRTYNTTVISIVESSVQWCNLVLHFVTNIMIWTKLSEVSTWKFRDSYVSWFIIISVNCFHDAANRDPKLLHFKYHYPVFYRLHSQIRSHSLTQSHMKDNDMRNLAGFLFSMIIHFHHCYIKISYTVKQAYKDGIAKFEMWCRTEEDQNTYKTKTWIFTKRLCQGKRKLTGGNVTSNTKLRNDVWQCNHYQNISSSK